MKTNAKRKTAAGIDPAELSKKRSAAARKGLAARWGEARQPGRSVRIDPDAFEKLQEVPADMRRAVASFGIIRMARSFCRNPETWRSMYKGRFQPSASTAGDAARIISSSSVSKV